MAFLRITQNLRKVKVTVHAESLVGLIKITQKRKPFQYLNRYRKLNNSHATNQILTNQEVSRQNFPPKFPAKTYLQILLPTSHCQYCLCTKRRGNLHVFVTII